MRNQYRSDFILQYKLGLLPKSIVKQIAPSTKNYWRNKDYNNFFAAEVIYTQEKNIKIVKAFLSQKQLLNAAKAIYHIFMKVQDLTQHSKQWHECLRNNKELVVKTIEQQKHFLGFKRTLKAFNISVHQFYAWRDTRNCKTSIFKLCTKRFPRQLNLKSVYIISNIYLIPSFNIGL